MQLTGKKSINILKSFLLCLLFTSMIAACTPRLYRDVSHEKEFTGLVGKKIESIIELEVRGITFDQDERRSVDYVFLSPHPASSGRHVKFHDKLGAGNKFVIIGVVVSDYFAFLERYYVVELLNENKFYQYKVLIDASGDINGPSLGLDDNAFKPVSNLAGN